MAARLHFILIAIVITAGCLSDSALALPRVTEIPAAAARARRPGSFEDGWHRLPSSAIGDPARLDERLDPTLPVPVIERPGGADASCVRGGDVVGVRWRDPGDQVEELEILVSLDDGRSFGMRVSPDLDGDERRFAWRVPNLASRDARLRIRVRVRGHELDGPIGARFAIESDRTRPRQRWPFLDRGWWDEGTRLPEERLAADPRGAVLTSTSTLPLLHPPNQPSLPSDTERALPRDFRDSSAPPLANAPPTHAPTRSLPIRE